MNLLTSTFWGQQFCGCFKHYQILDIRIVLFYWKCVFKIRKKKMHFHKNGWNIFSSFLKLLFKNTFSYKNGAHMGLNKE